MPLLSGGVAPGPPGLSGAAVGVIGHAGVRVDGGMIAAARPSRLAAHCC